NGGAVGDEILIPALKVGLVGQDRETGRPTVAIGPRETGRLEVGSDEALGRRRLLDFRDQGRTTGAGEGGKRCREAARWRRQTGAGFQGGLWPRGLACPDQLALLGADFGERIAHAGAERLEMAMSSASAALAPALA